MKAKVPNDRDPKKRPRHPIGVVARRTGLKPDLIRAWERRYGAVEPARSDTRRRLYTDADIERLDLLQQAVSAGRGIRHVANLPESELLELIAADRAATATPQGSVTPLTVELPADGSLIAGCLEAAGRLDGGELEALLERASVMLSRTALLEQLLVPLMRRIGELWKEGTLRPIHEHLATAVVRSFLGRLFNTPTATGAPEVIVTTPPQQAHELGAMMAAACAAAEGWRVTYLGPNLPAEEIAAAVRKKNARALVLGITYPPDDPQLGQEIERLARLLPEGTAVLAGGRSAEAYRDRLEKVPATLVADYSELRVELEEVRSRP